MVTVLHCTIDEHRFIVHFLWAKGLNAKDIHKCLSLKAVHKWAQKFSQGRSNVANDETEVRKWLRQQSTDFYAAGSDAMVK
jgi:hypothetical protein